VNIRYPSGIRGIPPGLSGNGRPVRSLSNRGTLRARIALPGDPDPTQVAKNTELHAHTFTKTNFKAIYAKRAILHGAGKTLMVPF